MNLIFGARHLCRFTAGRCEHVGRRSGINAALRGSGAQGAHKVRSILSKNSPVGRDSVEPSLPTQEARATRASRPAASLIVVPSVPSIKVLTAFASLRSKVGSTESRPTNRFGSSRREPGFRGARSSKRSCSPQSAQPDCALPQFPPRRLRRPRTPSSRRSTTNCSAR